MKYLIPAALVLVLACDDATDDVGGQCVESSLIAQCPAASSPILGARSEAQCSGAVGGIVSDGEGAATGQCQGIAGCRVYCQFAIPCRCGVAQIDADGVLCASCEGAAACGDGVCEAGENPADCPIDCGAACISDERRCVGDDLEVCSLQGRWDRLACPDREACVVGENGAECMRELDLITDDMGIDGGPDAGVIDDSRIIEGPADWPDGPDVRVEAFALPTAVHIDVEPNAGAAGVLSEVLPGAGDTVVALGNQGWVRLNVMGGVDATAAYPNGFLGVSSATSSGNGVGLGVRRDRSLLGAFELRRLQVDAIGPVGDYVVAARRQGSGPLRGYLFDDATAISPDGTTFGWIAVQDLDTAIAIWDRGQALRSVILPRSGPTVMLLALSPAGRALATFVHASPDAAVDDTISIWDVASEQRVLSLRTRDPANEVPLNLRFSPDGRSLAVLYVARDRPSLIEIWDMAQAERQHILTLPSNAVDVAWDWAADGRLLAVHHLVREPSGRPESGAVSIFDTQTGQRVLTHDLLGRPISVQFDSTGRLAVLSANPNRLVMYGPPRE